MMANKYGEGKDKDWRLMAQDLQAMADAMPIQPIPTLSGTGASFTHFFALASNLRAAEALCMVLAGRTGL